MFSQTGISQKSGLAIAMIVNIHHAFIMLSSCLVHAFSILASSKRHLSIILALSFFHAPSMLRPSNVLPKFRFLATSLPRFSALDNRSSFGILSGYNPNKIEAGGPV